MTIRYQWFESIDITGKNPQFKLTEEIDLTDKSIPFIVPNHPPFFVEGLIVKDASGLITTTGWNPGGELIEAIEYTGKQVCQWLQLEQDFLNKNSKITIIYQAITVKGTGRNELKNKFDTIIKEHGLPIDWRSQVSDKPASYPFLRHQHKNDEEIRGWEELSYYFRLLVGTYQINHPNIPPIDEAVAQMGKQQQKEKLSLYSHDGSLENEHGVTPVELGIDKIDNFPLATLQEDIDGLKDNVFSTPHGAVAAVKQFKVNSANVMESDGFPMSAYGRNGFIQPSVQTGMNVLGSKYESSAICLEDSGELVLLSNRCDGRKNALFYTRCLNFKGSKPTLTLTGTEYTSSILTIDKVVPNYVIGGSNCKVLMLGDIDKNTWYCTLTNGTLDMRSHHLVKVDVTNCQHFNPVNTTIHLMGDWIYLFSVDDISDGEEVLKNGAIYVYRFAVNLLKGSDTILPSLVRINYEMLNKVKVANADCFVLDNHNKVSGGFNKYIFNYSSDVERVKHLGKWQVISWPLTESSHLHAVNMFVCLDIKPILTTGENDRIKKTFQFLYTFNAQTNTFAVGENNFFGGQTIDPNNILSVPRIGDIENFDYKYYTIKENQPSSIILRNGMMVTSFTEYGGVLGLLVFNPFKQDKTPFQILSTPLTKENFSQSLIRKTIADFESPNGMGNIPSPVFYNDTGEMFRVRGWVNGKTVCKTFYRPVTGEYSLTTELDNLKGENYIRPLSDKVIPVLESLNGIIGITGTKNKLTQMGLKYGKVEFSANSMYKNNGMWYNHQGTMTSNTISLDSLHDKHIENEFLEITITKKRVYPFEAFREALKTTELAGPSNLQWESRNMALTVYDFSNFKIAGLDHALVISGNPENTKDMLTSVIFFNATFKNNTLLTATPIKTFNLRSKLNRDIKGDVIFNKGNEILNYTCYSQIFINDQGLIDVIFGSDNNYFDNGYKAFTGWFKIDNTGTITQHAFINDDWLTSGYQAIYNEGICLTNHDLLRDNGYCLGVCQNQDNPVKQFITISPYLQNNWTIFFNSEEPLTLNGNFYSLQIGTIYLPDITDHYQNKTFYIYATVINGVAQYILTVNPYRNPNNDIVGIGKVVTDDKGIVSIKVNRAVIFGKTYISGNPAGI